MLNRLELTPEGADAQARYKKVVYNAPAFDALMVDVFLDANLSLNGDAPLHRPIHGAEIGPVLGLPHLGGLHMIGLGRVSDTDRRRLRCALARVGKTRFQRRATVT